MIFDSPSNNRNTIPLVEMIAASQTLFLMAFLKPNQVKKGTIIVLNPVINAALPAVVV